MKLRTWQQTLKDGADLIVQASHPTGNDSWQSFPIGMSWQFVYIYDKLRNLYNLQIGPHTETVFCGISENTDGGRRCNGLNRRKIIETLQKNNIFNRILNPFVYFATLPNVRFVVSPEGSGIDCHRHYEALLAGCIPILERNPLTEAKYGTCPVLWTTDYSEITEEYLQKRYEEMLDTEYDFSPLLLRSYPPDRQAVIREYGNSWTTRLCGGVQWYGK